MLVPKLQGVQIERVRKGSWFFLYEVVPKFQNCQTYHHREKVGIPLVFLFFLVLQKRYSYFNISFLTNKIL
jgi:hypothetical protein